MEVDVVREDETIGRMAPPQIGVVTIKEVGTRRCTDRMDTAPGTKIAQTRNKPQLGSTELLRALMVTVKVSVVTVVDHRVMVTISLTDLRVVTPKIGTVIKVVDIQTIGIITDNSKVGEIIRNDSKVLIFSDRDMYIFFVFEILFFF